MQVDNHRQIQPLLFRTDVHIAYPCLGVIPSSRYPHKARGLNHTTVVNHLCNRAAQFVAEPRSIEVSALNVRFVNGLVRAVVKNYEVGGGAIDPFGGIQAQNCIRFGNYGT